MRSAAGARLDRLTGAAEFEPQRRADVLEVECGAKPAFEEAHVVRRDVAFDDW